MIPLKEHYKTTVVPELKEKLGLSSVMAVPKVTKITLNMGVGEALNDKKILESAGLNLSNVVKAFVFMINPDDYVGMNSVYAEIMPQPYPAREAIFVAGLPKGAIVEISVIAKD